MDLDIEDPNGENDIEVNILQPSKFYEDLLPKVMVDYTRFDPTNWANFEDYAVTELPLLNEQSVLLYLDQFCQDFNETPQETIFTDVTDVVADVGQYLCELIPSKSAYQIACNWPPLLPNTSPYQNAIISVILRILRNITDQTKFYHFIKFGFFKKIWTTKSCFTNQYLVSVARVKYKGKDNYWAMIDQDRLFKLYEIKDPQTVKNNKDKSGCEMKICGNILKAYVSVKENNCEIVDVNNKTLCIFSFVGKELPQFWEFLYTRQKIPFPFYMQDSADFFPDEVYEAMHNMVTANDSVVLNSLLNSDMFEPKIWEALVRVYAHARKTIFLVEGITAFTFNDDFEFNVDSFDVPNHFVLFCRAIGKVYWKNYMDEFMNKIVALVDYHDDIDSADVALIDETVAQSIVFNVLKYIVQSHSYVPKEWSYAMNIIRQYCNVRYNSQAKTLLSLGIFFKSIIYSFFKENTKFSKGMNLAHPENFPMIGYLLSIPLQFCVYSANTQRFAGWNKRLEKHFFPKYAEFLFRISDFKETEFEFEIPDNKMLGYSVKNLLKYFMTFDFNEKLKQELVRQMDDKSRIATLPGWNFCVVLSNLFVHMTDPSEFVKKKKEPIVLKPISLPKNLPQYGANYVTNANLSDFRQLTQTKQKKRTGENRRGMGIDINKPDENEEEKFVIPDFEEIPTLELPDLPAAKRWKPTTLSDSDAVSDSTSDIDYRPKSKYRSKKDNRKKPKRKEIDNRSTGSIISFGARIDSDKEDESYEFQ